MCSEDLESTNFIKIFWPAKLCTYFETSTIYSNSINHNNVVFEIGAKFNLPSLNSLSLWVRKSSSELANASIRVTFDSRLVITVHTDDWKEICNITNSFDLSQRSKQLLTVSDHQYYSYDLSITCEIIFRENIIENSLYDEMHKFYNSEELSDITIIVDQVKIPAHRVILSAHSPVFSRMLQSDMKEAREGVINIKDLDLEIILDMLHYFYTGETKATYDIEVALSLIEVADIYQIEKLKKICFFGLHNNITIDNVLRVVNIADDHKAIDVCNTAIQFIVRNIDRKMFMSSEFKQLCFKKEDLMSKAITAGVYKLTID